jgi:outer membrane protein assembly factor BamB/tRNA A-37 threonylcarbamoyl transferase component Bud32
MELQEFVITCIIRQAERDRALTVSELDTRRIAAEDRPITVQPEGTLPAHTVLQERYEILSVQGVGGMGAVYRARDLRFSAVEKIVAVKEMANTAPDPRMRQMSIQNFVREANILASLSHPAIPKIFDYFSESSRSYLILEFIEGQNLEHILDERREPFPQEQVVDWGLQVCNVLAYLHNRKPPVIFRDIKPGNLILKPDGRLMVIDFGIAKVFEHGQRGTMIGTEGYSPPEQYRGIAEPRGDLYALGATLHHMLTGRDPRLEPPFSFHERPIRLLNPQVSPELEAAITKSLAYDMQERYSSAVEFAAELSKALPQGRRVTGGLGTAGLGTAGVPLPQDIVPKWMFTCEDEVRSSPRISNNVLYVGCYDNNLYALDARTGSFLWKFATDGGIAATPCLYEDVILIGSEDGSLYAVSQMTGKRIWACPTNSRVRSSVRVEYGHAFFGSDDGNLYAVNVQSGRPIWKLQTAGPVRSTPLITNETIYMGSDDGYIYAVDMRTGGIVWKYDTHRRVTSSPAIDNDLILVGSADGHLYGVNARSGWPVWRFRTGGYVFSSPMVVGGLVYFGSADGSLYAVDSETGRQYWKCEIGSAVISSPAVANDVVYVGSTAGTVYAVDAKRGHNIWSYVTQGAVPSSPLVDGDTVYVGSADHRVYALPA